MKNRTRKLLAGVVALSLVGAFALFGCSGGTTEGSSSSASSAAEQQSEPVELQIFAANSLSKAMDEVQALYTEQNPNVTFADTQYLSSGELNEQLAGGAYADVLISASKGKMDEAVEEGYVDESTRFDMFQNDLVMVAGEGSELAEKYGADQSFTLDDIATGDYSVAVGDDSVPAGNYANQSLSTVGCFVDPDGATGADSAGTSNGTDAYAGTPLDGKVSLQSSVGNVCKQAESGAVDVAFVYSSDVFRFGGVQVIGVVPADTHKDIIYPCAICSDSEHAEAAQAFIDWAVSDPEALKLWQEWGFELA